MAGSRELYELMGSLNKTEKRYCRMMLASGAGRRAKSCLRLFEIVSAMCEPDEPAVRAAVKGEPFAGHLSVTKHHLYEHLLRSLRTFGAARTVRSRLHALIEEADVLSARGLIAQARQRLREARELAERHDCFPEQLVIVRQAWMLDMNEGCVSSTVECLRERRERVDAILSDIANYWDHLHVSTSLGYELLHRGPGVENGRGRPCEDLGRRIRELPPPRSDSALRLHMKVEREYHLLTARFDEAYEHSLESLRLVESFPMRERIERFDYPAVLYHHVNVALQTGRIEEAREAFERLDALHGEERASSKHLLRQIFCCRLELLLVDLDHVAMAAAAGELEAICGEDDNNSTRQLRIGYALQLAYAQFVNGSPREAARTLHPLINEYRPGFRDDALCMARLYRLMIHYDLGDIELLPYLVRSTYRFIARCRRVSGVDRAVLRFMRRLTGVATREELVTELRRVREELVAVAVDPAEYEASAIPYILPWLDSKITGRPFGELAREARRGVREVAAG